MTTPEFHKLGGKINARSETIIKIYRQITGFKCIPPEKQYWTLSGGQPKHPGTEINQLTKAKLMAENQFFGVDLSRKNIIENRKAYPNAQWFSGNFKDIILRERLKNNFNPAMVYLDTMHISGRKPCVDLSAHTLRYCPEDTIAIINTMQNNPRSSEVHKRSDFIKAIKRSLSPLENSDWDCYPETFTYQATKQTAMTSYIFRRSRV